jgi:hypothetical protein
MPNIPDFIAAEMLEGEEVKWHGQPDPAIVFAKKDWLLIPFSLMWGGFALLWESMAIFAFCASRGMPSPAAIIPTVFPLFGFPFCLIGLYFIFGRFYVKKLNKQKTTFVVTNKRVLSVFRKSTLNTSIKSLFIERLPAISKSINADGNGSITFGNEGITTKIYVNTGLDFLSSFYGPDNSITFYDIKDVETVYQLVSKSRSA